MTVADLSPDAIRARQVAGQKTGTHGGWTGRELVDVAAGVFDRAKRFAKLAQKRSRGSRADAASRNADQALVHAAIQIRVAQICPLDRPYLHALSLEQIQDVRDQVAKAFDKGAPELAVDTHRRIQSMRMKVKAARG
jgi:hypothetical protein